MRLRGCRVSASAADAASSTYRPPSFLLVIPVLGVTQILAWGSSYYLLAVLAQPIAGDTGWSLAWIVGGLSLGLLVAGIVSPRVGDNIQRLGGRMVLATSAVFLALGLIGLALSPNLPIYILSWLLLGVGMGAGLYDAAFATLGRLYGQRARTAIATLTLFGAPFCSHSMSLRCRGSQDRTLARAGMKMPTPRAPIRMSRPDRGWCSP
jgi:MFS family permease